MSDLPPLPTGASPVRHSRTSTSGRTRSTYRSGSAGIGAPRTLLSASPRVNSFTGGRSHFAQPFGRAMSYNDLNEELLHRKTVLGICALDKKASSKPMKAILKRMEASGDFDIVVFGDDCIHNKTIEEWPICDACISYFSDGFPLEKAIAYYELRKPFLLNDLYVQRDLLDRRRVYDYLLGVGIAVPTHIKVNRIEERGYQINSDDFEESEDYVMLKSTGQKIKKPFVEKPVSGEDHNVCIYYPSSMGGGCKQLFRKQGDKSGEFLEHVNEVRRDGSYLYEEFLPTGGTDVKVYTVGPQYAHAEARKAPSVDGKVQRSEDGKEVRYPILLSPAEKKVACLVVQAFKQSVCGFDLLRCKGMSYVCDVNGWSHVKNSERYYDDAARLMRILVLHSLCPARLLSPLSNLSVSDDIKDEAIEAIADMGGDIPFIDEPESKLELRCVLAVVRHADRTPKQKMKMKVAHPAILALLRKHGKKNKDEESRGDVLSKEAKLKTPKQLTEVLEVIDTIVRAQLSKGGDSESEEALDRYNLVRDVLVRGGKFSGINRKVQIKPTEWETVELPGGGTDSRVVEAQLILKHGGVLTHAGRKQAEKFGAYFRSNMYVGEAEGGLLRLHSTFRHDLKVYSSDEGRVQMSAAAFTKGLLDLEGQSLAPILTSLVRQDASMLEMMGKGVDEDIQRSKKDLYHCMTCEDTDNLNKLTWTPGKALWRSKQEGVEGGAGTGGDLEAAAALLKGRDEGEGEGEGEQGVACPLNVPKNPHAEMVKMAGLLKMITASIKKKLEASLQEQFSEESEDESSSPDSPRDAATPARDGREKGDGSSPPPRAALKGEVFDVMTGRVSGRAGKPCGNESLRMMFERWKKLEHDFFSPKKAKFDISKIPDIYDSAKYDALHNHSLSIDGLHDTYALAKELADIVVPNEYGISDEDKLNIGMKISCRLTRKLMVDLRNTITESRECDEGEHVKVKGGDSHTQGDEEDDQYLTENRLHPDFASSSGIKTASRHVRTRVYYTSESHLHSLLNVLSHCPLAHDMEQHGPVRPVCEEKLQELRELSELDYNTHIVIRMFEDKGVPIDDPQRFLLEILFSPGSKTDPRTEYEGHAMPIVETTFLQGEKEGGDAMMTFQELETLLMPFEADAEDGSVGGSALSRSMSCCSVGGASPAV